MKLLTIATKLDLKVSRSTARMITKTKKVIKRPMKLNKTDIKITTKIFHANSAKKILEKNKKLIKKIKRDKKTNKVKKQKLILKKKKIAKKIKKATKIKANK